MARFDIYLNPTGPGWLLDVQSDIIPDLGSRIVVPMSAPSVVISPVRFLNPTFSIGDRVLVMLTHLIFAIPTRVLGRPQENLSDHQDEIKRALDVALYGF